MKDIGEDGEAERDYLLARHLFPASRALYLAATWVCVRQSVGRFAPGEEGSPTNLADVINQNFERPLLLLRRGDEKLIDSLFAGYSDAATEEADPFNGVGS
jgi:hypothetical protein